MTLAPSDPDHLTQRELETLLWAAANALRGPVDPGDFKAYVFPIMFFKWISDVYDYRHEEALNDLGDEWTVALELEDYQPFRITVGSRWADLISTATNIGSKVTKVLLAIQEANPGKLDGVFGDVNWANKERLPESALKSLLGVFNELTLDPDHVSGDMLGSAYEYLLREFAESAGKKAGEFFTPRHVVHLLVTILDPKPGDSICDPACGSAGMLVETVEAVKHSGGNPDSLFLYGQEQNLTTAAMARMNLYLHGVEDFEIRRGDTFREPKLKTPDGKLRQFDVVIANPPFSLQNWGAEKWAKDPHRRAIGGIVPPPKNGDWAWIQHMASVMKPEVGRVGVVMPHGALFRGGSEGSIREHFVREDLLDAVIGLPNNLFYSTTIPVCLLIFRSNKALERRGKVTFVDARFRVESAKNQNTLSEDDVQVINRAYNSLVELENDNGVSVRTASIAEIEKHGFDLSIGDYIKVPANVEVDVQAALLSLRQSQLRRSLAQEALDSRLREAGFDA